jgi:hypothetical protein
LLELEKWAKEDSVVVDIFKEVSKEGKREKKQNRRLRELQISMLYNPRYREEKKSNTINLDALRSYNNLNYLR